MLLASYATQTGARAIAQVATFSTYAIESSHVLVPPNPATGDFGARDVDMTSDGRWAVFNGASNPSLAIYNPSVRTWTHLTFPGWSISNNYSYGGLTAAGRYVFAPDMFTFGGEPIGIVRFDLVTKTATRFADTHEYTDLNIGNNGKLYALRGDNGPIDVYDPAMMTLENTITPAAGNIIRGVDANAAGQVFIVDWAQNIYKLDATGQVLASYHMAGNAQTPGFANTHDIDISRDGSKLVVGSEFGWGVQMTTSFTNIMYFRGGFNDLHVSFMERAPSLPVVPVARVNDPVVAEGHSGTRLLNFTVRLSAPTTRAVFVDYATQDGTATAGTDYTAASGTLTFGPGQTAKTVSVIVNGDVDEEPDETLELALSDPKYLTIADDTGIGTIRSDDHAPVAAAGPDRSINEGGFVSFSATGSFDLDRDLVSYEWDFGDGFNKTGFFTSHQYLDNGTYTATLTVRDASGRTDMDTALIAVANLPPTGGLSGPGVTVPGWARPYRFFGTDPGPADRPTLQYQINWGDTQTQTVTGGVSTTVRHAYTTAGTYTIVARVKDKDGGLSPEYKRTVVVKPWLVEGSIVYVAGTTGNDTMTVRTANTAGTQITVALNGQDVGTWLPAGVTLFAREGADTVTTVGPAKPRLTVDGGADNDSIDVESAVGPTVLIGSAGDDVLKGGAGRDVLIGGAGSDTLDGRGNEDILLAASLTYQSDPLALKLVSAEWNRATVSYETRRDHLLGELAGGLNRPNLLDSTTVVDDGVSDSVTGGTERDWFFNSTAIADNLLDLATDETVTTF